MLSVCKKNFFLSFIVRDDDFTKNFKVTKEMLKKKIHEYTYKLNYTLDVETLTKAIKFMYLPRNKDIQNETLLRNSYINVSIYIYDSFLPFNFKNTF